MAATPFLNSRLPQLWHGGDYNPEQWSRETWQEDVRLMEIAHFKVATLGVFSWVKLEPEEGRFEFGWLDQVIEALASRDRFFILATPSAAPPAWMSRKYPEILRTGADRVRRQHGNRVNTSLSSPIYRRKCEQIAWQLAHRYGDHPNLLAWHVSNEYGGADYSPDSIAAFREWLREKYGTLDALNAAYWTAFWSHTYTAWEEIGAPGAPYAETAIQGLTVDWQRFVTDQTVDFMLNEARPLREISPHVPLTTNFMGTYAGLNYRKFVKHLDFTSWDSYPAFRGALKETRTWTEVAFKNDLTRCLAENRKWMLMECSPSSSNWYSRMGLKDPGMHRFEALQPIAQGADGAQYFQWRQSRGGQEQLHGAVVNHGTAENGRVFKDVQSAGESISNLDGVAGSAYEAQIAIVFDWESMWALDAACGPVQGDKGYERTCIDFYEPFWSAGISVDVIGQSSDLSAYKVVIAPMAYSLQPGFADRVTKFVESGGVFLTTFLTGWTDENSLILEEGLLGPLRKVLGIWSEELDVVEPNEGAKIQVSGFGGSGEFAVGQFCELIHTQSAETLATYASKFYGGRPALTVNQFGAGRAYYFAAQPEAELLELLLTAIAGDAKVEPAVRGLPKGVTAHRRTSSEREWIFLLNATPRSQTVTLPDGIEVALDPWDVSVHSEIKVRGLVSTK